MRVTNLAAPGAEWDAYVSGHGAATLGHAAAWARVLSRAYGLSPAYLVARDDGGAVRGVLPLARLRLLDGRLSHVSLPFLDAAGLLADDRLAAEALLREARSLGEIELRQQAPVHGFPVAASDRVDCVLSLDAGAGQDARAAGGDAAGRVDARWRALPGKVRNQVRKARKEGLVASRDGDLSDFHRLHRMRMRELGSPPHAEGFFREIADAFGARARFIVARDGSHGPVLGALLAVHFGRALHVPWASTLRRERARCANHLIYWEALCLAEECGAEEFDFGRSPRGSGSHRFKRSWGAQERPLYWTRFERGGEAARSGHSGAEARLLRPLVGVWRHLPQAVCDRVGPALRRRIAS